jgi:hypothetical protein
MISVILRKNQVMGLQQRIMDNNNISLIKKLPRPTNSDKGKKSVEVDILLGLSENKATKYYTEFGNLQVFTS